jgi:hypothetical protein
MSVKPTEDLEPELFCSDTLVSPLVVSCLDSQASLIARGNGCCQPGAHRSSATSTCCATSNRSNATDPT